MFNTSEITTLLKIIGETDFDDVELKAGDFYIRLRNGSDDAESGKRADEVVADAPAPASVPDFEPDNDAPLFEVKSTTVGTFYAASGPGEEPFVKVGDHVTATQQVGLVEVMKLFNAIEAGVNGTVVAIQALDANLVEYGEVLMTIRPDKA